MLKLWTSDVRGYWACLRKKYVFVRDVLLIVLPGDYIPPADTKPDGFDGPAAPLPAEYLHAKAIRNAYVTKSAPPQPIAPQTGEKEKEEGTHPSNKHQGPLRPIDFTTTALISWWLIWFILFVTNLFRAIFEARSLDLGFYSSWLWFRTFTQTTYLSHDGKPVYNASGLR